MYKRKYFQEINFRNLKIYLSEFIKNTDKK